VRCVCRIILVLVGLSSVQAAAEDLDPPLAEGEFLVQAYSAASVAVRTTLFYIPPSAPARSRALVMVLHGGGETDLGELLNRMRRTGWNELADRDGFVVAYPTGLKDPNDPDARYNWNDGRLGTDIWAMPDHADIDDVGYFAELIAGAQAYYGVGERAYAIGISNGGYMAHRLAMDARTNPLLRAIGTVVSQIPTDIYAMGLPAPMPLFAVAGSEDPLVPFNGGPVTIQLELEDGTPVGAPIVESTVTSFADSVGLYLQYNGCDPGRVIDTKLPDTVDDGTYVEYFGFRRCGQTGAAGQRADVAAYVVWGGGHRWQGRGGNGPDEVRSLRTENVGGVEVQYWISGGLSTQDGFDTTESAWNFFRRH